MAEKREKHWWSAVGVVPAGCGKGDGKTGYDFRRKHRVFMYTCMCARVYRCLFVGLLEFFSCPARRRSYAPRHFSFIVSPFSAVHGTLLGHVRGIFGEGGWWRNDVSREYLTRRQKSRRGHTVDRGEFFSIFSLLCQTSQVKKKEYWVITREKISTIVKHEFIM